MAMKSKSFDYFDAFYRQAQHCVRVSDILVEVAHNWTSADDIPAVLERAHEVEHEADQINHEIYQAAAKDFVTPIEREDILSIAHSLDNVIDRIEDVIRDFYMYDARVMADGTKEFTQIINRSCRALEECIGEFRSFKKSKKMHELTTAINDCEEEADILYVRVMRNLHTADERNLDSLLVMRIVVWSRIFRAMEGCCDAIEHVADVVNTVVLRNS